MKLHLTSATRLALVASLAACLPLAESVADTIEDRNPTLVTFGDSLSDAGNYFISTGESSIQPFLLVPSAPYALGGFHFTNGDTWAEQLAGMLNDRNAGHPSLKNSGHFTNYAFGTARSRAGQTGFDLGDQVAMFLNDFGNVAPDETIYIIWTGGNDVRDALGALQFDPTGGTSGAILNAALTATADNIAALYSSGARRFLVANAPNIGLTPAVRGLGPQVEVAALQLSAAYNHELSGTLDSLAALPGIQIDRLDAFGILAQIVADPAPSGFTNVTDPCITPAVLAAAICEQPGRFLFWDGIHPTRAAHRVLAAAALLELGD
jgi:phospholipase/lecithinase/hemolysin